MIKMDWVGVGPTSSAMPSLKMVLYLPFKKSSYERELNCSNPIR
jgi:hypothetical protein